MHTEKDVSTCSDTKALIFRTPEHIRRQEEELAGIKDENAQLKAFLAALVAAQPKAIRQALPKELRALSQNPPNSES